MRLPVNILSQTILIKHTQPFLISNSMYVLTVRVLYIAIIPDESFIVPCLHLIPE